jgi:hypothetical protein
MARSNQHRQAARSHAGLPQPQTVPQPNGATPQRSATIGIAAALVRRESSVLAKPIDPEVLTAQSTRDSQPAWLKQKRREAEIARLAASAPCSRSKPALAEWIAYSRNTEPSPRRQLNLGRSEIQ